MTQFQFKYRDYPLIPIKFQSNGRETPLIDALLDSGGDFIVIPNAIAKYLDLQLSNASDVDTAGGTTQLSCATVNMTIVEKHNNYTYKDLEIHVSDRNDLPVLLGRSPIFEDHEITFKKHKNQLILSSLR